MVILTPNPVSQRTIVKKNGVSFSKKMVLLFGCFGASFSKKISSLAALARLGARYARSPACETRSPRYLVYFDNNCRGHSAPPSILVARTLARVMREARNGEGRGKEMKIKKGKIRHFLVKKWGLRVLF